MFMHVYTDVTHGDIAMQNINYNVTGEGNRTEFHATLIDLDCATFKNVREAMWITSNILLCLW